MLAFISTITREKEEMGHKENESTKKEEKSDVI